MPRMVVSLVALTLLAATVVASDPTSGRATMKPAPGKMTLPSGHYLEGHWPQYFPAEEKSSSDRVIEIMTWPARQIVRRVESLLLPYQRDLK
jgi:hypothetical protein